MKAMLLKDSPKEQGSDKNAVDPKKKKAMEEVPDVPREEEECEDEADGGGHEAVDEE